MQLLLLFPIWQGFEDLWLIPNTFSGNATIFENIQISNVTAYGKSLLMWKHRRELSLKILSCLIRALLI